MDIRLAGFNVEKEILDQIDPQGKVIGPEVFSAAYARISRSNKSIDQLRSESRTDIDKARKSNEKIIFGMGHHSVAEHAVFNFDLMSISRLALEAVEQFRLVSYTEKSQRYVTLRNDWILAQEIQDAGLTESFTSLVETLYGFYHRSAAALFDRLCAQHGIPEKKTVRTDLECRAKEDARYVLPLSAVGQVGMTINARNLEHLLRRLRLSPLNEVQRIGQELYRLTEPITPSLLLFPDPSRFESQFSHGDRKVANDSPSSSDDPFQLNFWEIPDHGDDTVLALLLSYDQQVPFAQASRQVERFSLDQKRKWFADLFRSMEFFDAPPRQFEFISISFEAIVSASCYAQLKRHRMATLIAGPYDPELGHTIPDQHRQAGLDDELERLIAEVDKFYHKHATVLMQAAQYALTNAHRRRVMMRFNLRDLYHFIRLRADAHSQWEIRDLALRIESRIRAELPLTGMMLAGKDMFPARHDELTRQ